MDFDGTFEENWEDAIMSMIQRNHSLLPCKRRIRKEPIGHPVARLVESPPAFFLCGICRNVANRPLECRSCGQLVCGLCASAVSTTGEGCVGCSCGIDLRKPSQLLVKMIGELKTRCANSEKGCRFEVAISEAGEHEIKCPFREVWCENNGFCRRKGMIKDFLETEASIRSLFSQVGSVRTGIKRYTCSEGCRKLMEFKKLVREKQNEKALEEYVKLLRDKEKKIG
jgi:hypothetical protein